MIKKEGNKYILYSKDGSKKLGSFDSQKEAEEREAEINRIKHAKAGLHYIDLTITKATLQDDGTMRWQAVASDTAPDQTGERTSLPLFRDWIERTQAGKSVSFLPPARAPFLGLSHYPDLDGLGEAGPTEKMYIDGSIFKAAGTFYRDEDHPLGPALFQAVRKEQALIKKGETIPHPIRISAAWWDISHSHGDFIFERKSLTDKCPMCEQGATDKVYLKGQLDHFAATRVPINPRTSLELEQKAMTTRKEDAASIIEDEQLIEQIDQQARLTGKSEAEEELPDALVVRADEEPVIEQMMDDDEAYHRPMAGAMSLDEAQAYIEAQERMSQVYSNWSIFNTVMGNVLEMSEPGKIKGNVQNLLTEFGDRIAAIKAAIEDVSLIEPVFLEKGEIQMTTQAMHPADVFKAKYDEIMANPTLDRDAKLKALQEQFNGLGQTVKAQVDAVSPPDVTKAIAEAMAPIVNQLALITQQLSGRPAQTPAAQPQQKSYAPSGPVNPQLVTTEQLPVSPITGQPSALRAQILRSVGIQ